MVTRGKYLLYGTLAASLTLFVWQTISNVARIGAGRKRDLALTLGLAALAAGILKELSDWDWYGFSATYTIVNVIDLTIQFAIAGIVIAWIYKREMQGAPGATVR